MVSFQNFVLRFVDGSDVLAFSVTNRTVLMKIFPKAASNVLGYLINSKISKDFKSVLNIFGWLIRAGF